MVERMGELLQASRVRVTRKRLDLIAALDRRSGEAMRELRRRLATQRQAVDRDASRLGPSAERLLARHVERIAALGAIVDAKDFRRRGWVMASDGGGHAVKSVTDLHIAGTVEFELRRRRGGRHCHRHQTRGAAVSDACEPITFEQGYEELKAIVARLDDLSCRSTRCSRASVAARAWRRRCAPTCRSARASSPSSRRATTSPSSR